MLTLSKGFKKPQNPDTGDVFYPALEQDIQQLNDHTHNGIDSQLLAITTQSILSAAWVASTSPTVGGLYMQTVAMPAGFLYDTTDMFFRRSSGEMAYPSIVRVSTTSYTIYSNDNSLNYTAFYR